jgi:hypothetical protein
MMLMNQEGGQVSTEEVTGETPIPPGRNFATKDGKSITDLAPTGDEMQDRTFPGIPGATQTSSVSPLADMNPAQISNLLAGVTGTPQGFGDPGVFKYLLQLMGGDR